MPYNDIFTNDVYQNEHDEDMTRKHPNYYKAIKTFFPEVYKLPEDEITPMIDILKNQGDTYDEAASLVKNYINQKKPVWNQNYFNDKNQSVKTKNITDNIKLVGNTAYDLLNSISLSNAAFDTAAILYDTKKQMERDNVINKDNYYHRLAMCEIGKKGNENIFYPVMGLGGGVLKEIGDVTVKTYRHKPIRETLKDSWKDLGNNWEALNYGLNNPQKDCKIWLQDLDYNTNTWRK